MNQPATTIEEIKAIVMAEKEYWDKVDPFIGIAASGACCNIMAAIYGLRAPWHPQIQPTLVDVCPESAWEKPTTPDTSPPY